MTTKEEITVHVWKHLDLEQRKKVNWFIEEKINEVWYEIASFKVRTIVESLTNDTPPEDIEKSDLCDTLDTEKVENWCTKCNKAFNETPYNHVIQEHFYELFSVKLTDFLGSTRKLKLQTSIQTEEARTISHK